MNALNRKNEDTIRSKIISSFSDLWKVNWLTKLYLIAFSLSIFLLASEIAASVFFSISLSDYIGILTRNNIGLALILCAALAGGGAAVLDKVPPPPEPPRIEISYSDEFYLKNNPLSLGDRDNPELIRKIKAAVQGGAPEDYSGVYDQAIESAIIDFQEKNGLSVDGDVGEETITAIIESLR